MKSLSRRSSALKMGVAATVLCVALAACGGSGDEDAADGGNGGVSSAATVDMRLIQYQPQSIEVAVGEEVTWTQSDAGFHTVTSGEVIQAGGGVTTEPDDRFDSGELSTDETFKFTFSEPGTYPYFCEIHPATMTGEVRVGA